jgi:uncharacterized protein (TIGR02147 family)
VDFGALVSLNLISQGSEGRWVPTHNRVSTQNDIASQAIRKAHEASFESAKKALHEVAVSDRFFMSATMPADSQNYEIAVSMLKDTLNRISSLFETSGKEEVYKLQLGLFPLTNLKNRENQQ